MHEEKVITIEKVVFGGKGLSRDLSKVTFVPFTLPGEKVRVRIKKEHRDYLEAEAREIVEASAARVSPECRYFGRCGGCQISHATYETQVRMKKEILEETLRRSRLELPEIQVITSQPFEYRHRARLKYDAAGKRLGFYEFGSHQIVDIRECLCLTPGLNVLLATLRKSLVLSSYRGVLEIDCYENDQGQTAAYFDEKLPAAAKAELEHCNWIVEAERGKAPPLTLGFRNYEFPMQPDVFLQANPRLWKAMIQEVESHYPVALEETAVELYCGAGFFTVPLSRRFKKIIAVEENPVAVKWAKDHYQETNIDWICRKAERFEIPRDVGVVIVDPPRAGLSKNVIQQFRKDALRRISYVSCDCSSLARDIRILSDRFRLSRLTLLDLFPQTFHFETVALLEQISS